MKKITNIAFPLLIYLANLALILFTSSFALAEQIALKDPTRPPGKLFSQNNYTMSQQPSELNAVFIYPTYRLAIIDSQIVKLGDRLGEFVITTINPYTVELVGSQNNKIILQLAAEIKQKSK